MADNRGGKRKGAGRPPGAKTRFFGNRPPGVLHSLPDNSVILSELPVQYPEKAMRAAAELARGRSGRSVCKLVDISLNTLADWRKTPFFAQLIENQISKLCVDPTEVFKPMLPDMIKAYESGLKKLSFEVARDVADRTFGKPITRVQSDSKFDIVIEFRKQSEYIDAEIVNDNSS